MRWTSYLVIGLLIALPGCGKKSNNVVETPWGSETKVLDPEADPRGNTYGEQVQPAPPKEEKAGEQKKVAGIGGLVPNRAMTPEPQQPLRRHSRTPWFTLSNVRLEDSEWGLHGRKVVLMDFVRTELGDAKGNTVELMVRSKDGSDHATGFGNFDTGKSGTIRLSLVDFGWIGVADWNQVKNANNINLELWLEQRSLIGGYFKVSNSVFLGKMGGTTLAREWNELEEKLITRWVRTNSIQPALLDGFIKYDEKTHVVPGAPIQAVGADYEWQPAEFLRANAPDKNGFRNCVIKFNKETTTKSVSQSSLSVSQQVLQDIVANPARFKPSVRLLAVSDVAIPDGWVGVEPTTKLVKGTPLQAESHYGGNKWEEVIVLDPATPAGTVKIHWNKSTLHDPEEKSRNVLIISQQTLALLEKPNADELFVDNLFKAENKVSEDFPPGYIPLPKGQKLLPGMEIQSEQHRSWYKGTILVVDGSKLTVRWEKYGSRVEDIDAAGVLVSEANLEELKDPKAVQEFAARAKAQQVGRQGAPAGYRAIDQQTRLVRGVPVKYERRGFWRDAVVLKVLDDNSLLVGDPESRSSIFEEKVTRDSVLVTKETLGALDDPEIAARYTKQLKDKLIAAREQYPIKIAIPQRAVVVTEKMPLEVGTPLGINWASSWYDVTVVDLGDEDMVRVQGDGPFHFAKDVFRQNLIIEKAVLATLERRLKMKEKEKQKAAEAAKAAPPAEKEKEEEKESPFKEE